MIEDSNNFEDVLNFNYKFKDIKSEFISMKQFDNIKIQADKFSSIKKLTEFIEELAGGDLKKSSNITETNKFLTFSYTCVDQNILE